MTDSPDPATSSPTTASPPAPARRLRRWLPRLAIIVVILLVVAEILLRVVLGLGSPPLLMSHPKMEYCFQPNQSMRRFFSRIRYNDYSMRSDDFPKTKSSPNEFRVIVVGDSVINGGVQTDQDNLATTILQRELSAKLNRPVVVGNASGPSWGPPNELGWMQTFGLLDADVLVLVQSSHDAVDVPTWVNLVGIAPEAPDRRPVSAVGELVSRYLVPRVRAGLSLPPVSNSPPGVAPSDGSVIDPAMRDEAIGALRQMIAMAHEAGARVILFQHLERAEADGALRPGHELIGELAESEGVEVFQLGPRFVESLKHGRDPWRDPIHPNDVGQRLLADAMLEALTKNPSTQPGQPSQ